MTMFCKWCGKEIADGSVLCPFCGGDLRAKPYEEQGQQAESEQPQYDQNGQYADYWQYWQQYQDPRAAMPPHQMYKQINRPAPAPDDASSGGWAFLSFLFPIVGLILFIVWGNAYPCSYPRRARSCGIGALIGVIVAVVAVIVLVIILALSGLLFEYYYPMY